MIARRIILIVAAWLFILPAIAQAQGSAVLVYSPCMHCPGCFSFCPDLGGNPQPPECPVCEEGAGAINIPRTGQTLCYDSNGNVVDCVGTGKGQDGHIQAGAAWPYPRFQDNYNGSMTDNLTGLVWLKDTNCISTQYPDFDADGVPGDGKVTWSHALDFVKGINNTVGTPGIDYFPNCGAGETDWRLANVNELESLMNVGEIQPLAWLATQGFKNLQSIYYWSSTTHAAGSHWAWVLDFYSGNPYRTYAGKYPGQLYPAWPVRGTTAPPAQVPKTGQVKCYRGADPWGEIPCPGTGQDGELQAGAPWPLPRFIENSDGTITDNLTGLMWLKDAACIGHPTWQAALDAIAAFNANPAAAICDSYTASYTDWRLANVNEQESLFNAAEGSLAGWLYGNGYLFSNVQAYYYWSSTSRVQNSSSATWVFGLHNGAVSPAGKNYTGLHIWPVRNAPPKFILTIAKQGAGGGTVAAANEPGIDCGADCVEPYEEGTRVELLATPEAGAEFTGWAGDPDCVDGIVTMNTHTTCTAGFAYSEDLQFDQIQMLRSESQIAPEFHFESGIPLFIRMRVPIPDALPDDPVLQALDFLDNYKHLYRLAAPRTDLYLKRIKTSQFDEIGGGTPDPSNRHLFFGQQKDGIPVHGASLSVHLKGNFIRSTGGNYLTDIPDFTPPEILSPQAEAIALASVNGTNAKIIGKTRLMYFNRGLTAIDGGPARIPTRLAWRVMARGLRTSDGIGTTWRYFVDAQDGTVLSELDNLRTGASDKDFDIETVNDTRSDTCWTLFGETSDDYWFDEDGPLDAYPGAAGDRYLDGQKAYDFTHLTYDFYHTNFGRHSWNVHWLWGEEQIEAMVHTGTNWKNAAFSSLCNHIQFGNSYVTKDIFAHEYTHGVISWTSDLEYENQSGALNESYADVIGAMVDDDDWLLGEDRIISGEDGGAGGDIGGDIGGDAGDGVAETGNACGNETDDDGDGLADEGCPETGTQCGNAADDDGDGYSDEGCPETGGQCGDGKDDDADGYSDEGCPETVTQCAGPNLSVDDDDDGFIDEGCPGSCQDGLDNGESGAMDGADGDCFLRDLSDPSRKDDPDHVLAEMSGDGQGKRRAPRDVECDSDDSDYNDCGWVHINSGIPDKAAQLLADGGVHPGSGVAVAGIGRTKLQRLYYDVMTQHLDSYARFTAARDETVEQAQDYVEDNKYGFTDQDLCSVRNAFAAVGVGDADMDCDGVLDNEDDDTDGDTILNNADNCPDIPNIGQEDIDDDHSGDRCDPDKDGDGINNEEDICPHIANADDADCDGEPDATDNCPMTANPGQLNTDNTGLGDACDTDDDDDGVPDDEDNCPRVPNLQVDSDGDGLGNVCDNCPLDANIDQRDQDGDNHGDVCDPDRDGDGEPNDADSCPDIANLWQDGNGNGMDLACDLDEQFLLSGNFADFFAGNFSFPDLTDALRIPISPCIDDGCPDWIAENYLTEVSLGMPAGMQARIVDERGFGVTMAAMDMREPMRFHPAADSFFRFAAGAASPGADPRMRGAADVQPTTGMPAYKGRSYFLEIFPSAGVVAGQLYPFTVRVRSRLVDPTDVDDDGYPVPADCDDSDAFIHPGAVEVCNGRDDDCDGHTDENAAPAQFTFADQTGVAVNTTVTSNPITVTGICTAAPISITGGTYSTNGGAYTSLAGTVSIGNTVRVRVTSSGSNSATTSATLTIGGVSDTFSVTTSPDTPPQTQASPAGGFCRTAKKVTLSTNEPATVYYTTNGTIPTSGSKKYSTPISIKSTTTLKFFAVDAAGNEEEVRTETYVFDTVAPENGELAIATRPGDNLRFDLSWTEFPDRASGLKEYWLVFGTAGYPACTAMGPARIPTGTGRSYSHAPLNLGKTYYYRACASDNVGNVSTGAKAAKKVLPEYDPPTNGSVLIIGKDPYTNGGDTYTRFSTVTLALDATDLNLPLKMCVSNGDTCRTWMAYASTKTWKLSTGSGEKTVKVWFRDKYGNATPTPAFATTILDVTKPADGTLAIAPGLANTTFELSWLAADALSGVAGYRLMAATAGYPSCRTKPIYSGTETAFSHEGLTPGKTYYYRVCAVDNVGNVSTGAKASRKVPP
ncbi:MAG: Lcl domain-containing protein [Candidatus Geothermincolia bacterium]